MNFKLQFLSHYLEKFQSGDFENLTEGITQIETALGELLPSKRSEVLITNVQWANEKDHYCIVINNSGIEYHYRNKKSITHIHFVWDTATLYQNGRLGTVQAFQTLIQQIDKGFQELKLGKASAFESAGSSRA